MQYIVFLSLLVHSVCPPPPMNSVESPKVWASEHYFVSGKDVAVFNLLRYRNNSEHILSSVYQVQAGDECFQYKTGLVYPGEGVSNGGVLAYRRFTTSERMKMNVWVTVINGVE